MARGDYIVLKNPVGIISAAAVVTWKEKSGPLGKYFDLHSEDVKFGKKTFEEGESEMQRLALNAALAKAHMHHAQLEAVLAGDLMNQCTGSVYGLLDFAAPFMGLFGACSTAAEGLMLGALLADGGHFDNIGVVTSSHFCTAEKQFRLPLEYGGQRTPSAQWTVSGAGAFIVGKSLLPDTPVIAGVMPGRIVDKGIDDPSNMGAAMAPSAVDTILRFFRHTGASPNDFDVIATGDLGEVGYEITLKFLREAGIDISEQYYDCGMLIYDRKTQEVNTGGSGCGCSACVTAGYFMEKLRSREYRNILFVGTGALMSPLSVMQGMSIPGVAHLVHIRTQEN